MLLSPVNLPTSVSSSSSLNIYYVYWNDASLYYLICFVFAPMLQLIAANDFLVYNAFKF